MEQPRTPDGERPRPTARHSDTASVARRLGPAQELSAEEALDIAVETYIYAYPMILMDVTRRVTTSPRQVGNGAPMNRFWHMRTFPDATFTDVVRPNADTLYSSLFFDVSTHPLVISVPDSEGRYYLLPLLDLWSDIFASPGKRTNGTAAHAFAIVGPRWDGTLPHDVEEIRSPTALGWLIGRTQTNGKNDYAAVREFQAGLQATPLSSATKDSPSSAAASISSEPPVTQVAQMSATTFFSHFVNLTRDNPPHANDYPIIDRMKRIGLRLDQPFDRDRLPPVAARALDQTVPRALGKIKAHGSRAGQMVNGWGMMLSSIGTYGTDYLQRATIALMGLGANVVEDAIYPTALALADGTPFNAAAKYELRFAKRDIPPVNAFWSLTMYNDQQLFADNPISRYAIGDRDPLRFDTDGSLTLYIQREAPDSDKRANWLPTPKEGGFSMNLRLYWPKSSALDGTWAPPPVRQVG